MRTDNPEPTAALIFISDVANGDFEVTWDEDPSERGWKTWKVTATRVTSSLITHYWVQRRPAGFYLQAGGVGLCQKLLCFALPQVNEYYVCLNSRSHSRSIQKFE